MPAPGAEGIGATTSDHCNAAGIANSAAEDADSPGAISRRGRVAANEPTRFGSPMSGIAPSAAVATADPTLARSARPRLTGLATSLGQGLAFHPGPRTTRPGLAPVCSPFASTCTPFTKTCTMPVAYWCGSANVAWSLIASGWKTTMSA